MTDQLISRLADDLIPVPPRSMERRLLLAVATGFALTAVLTVLVFGLLLDRPFGAAWGSMMFWVKGGYALAFGLLGLAAAPALARPDGRIRWPLVGAAALLLVAICTGSMLWSQAGYNMPMLMGATALICPWLITLAALPMLGTLLSALRSTAPHSPTMAGVAAGLCAGGLGAATYAVYCAETGMMFMAVWYSLGIGIVAALGALLGRFLLRW
ncbi:DUF1109 domain-containing protein [Devosia rhizoryzae]|uniref:DUF1109 domain-containing protein n=1 Tax=Devosia rhizoryzae TaxID=2774137 RepID=A0ABX7C6D5_9HYPH|nr:DUF1109 domain-containing protein [Devosia rhizoryzae]QQR39828.1 DUF1109 domain-containing protein [Devosia rhizoryzae]